MADYSFGLSNRQGTDYYLNWDIRYDAIEGEALYSHTGLETFPRAY